MNICVFIPSEEQLAQGGVRIRYRRIERALQDLGHQLHVMPIQDFAAADPVHDVYIISKCYDARAYLVAHFVRGHRKLVGIDLFDDYFSQTRDSRFTRQRHSLRTLVQSADFVLSSTPAMHEVAASYAPQLPVHVMNDPATRVAAETVRQTLTRKQQYAHEKATLNVAWFGTGDNAHFPVGLADLVAFGGDLARLRGRGFDVRLDILTNHRAMTADALAMLRRLAVPYTVDGWTEEREVALLAKSLVCFLPVNAQGFSIAKSLNRAVSALCAGAQVLSSGYPLYQRLGALIYRDPEKLLHDLGRNSLALRGDTVPVLMDLVERLADQAVEANSLVEFLEERRQGQPKGVPAAAKPPTVALIHGRNSIGDAHKLAQRMGVLSICSPFCKASFDFDVRFSIAADGAGFDVLLAESCGGMLGSDLRSSLSPHGKIRNTTYHKLDAARLVGIGGAGLALAHIDSPMSMSASYPHVMANVEKVLEQLFPGVCCYYSEHAELPWRILPRAETKVHELT